MRKKLMIGVFLLALFFVGILVLTVVITISSFIGAKEKNYNIPMDNLPPIITEEMIIGSIESMEKYGVPASVTLAQIILESGGSYPGNLSQLAYEGKNLFGIKGEGPAGSLSMRTSEYDSGGSFQIIANFRRYHNFKESIDDHGKLLTTKRYTKYTALAKNSDEFAVAIREAGYATDPAYADTLKEIMKTYDLYRYDHLQLAKIGSGEAKGVLKWPLPVSGVLTSGYGYRGIIGVGDISTFHDGQDIAAPSGTPILAADGGVVVFTGWYGTGGNAIKIDHGNGYMTEYLHLRASDGIMVNVGDKVSSGQQIGRMGTTGASTGNHLHFNVRKDGVLVDPMLYVTQI